jgi:hypothetical protein
MNNLALISLSDPKISISSSILDATIPNINKIGQTVASTMSTHDLKTMDEMDFTNSPVTKKKRILDLDNIGLWLGISPPHPSLSILLL